MYKRYGKDRSVHVNSYAVILTGKISETRFGNPEIGWELAEDHAFEMLPKKIKYPLQRTPHQNDNPLHDGRVMLNPGVWSNFDVKYICGHWESATKDHAIGEDHKYKRCWVPMSAVQRASCRQIVVVFQWRDRVNVWLTEWDYDV